MADDCNPLVISVQQSLSSADDLEGAVERLNPVLRRLFEEARAHERAKAGGHVKVILDFSKSSTA